jgi:hypothetical protein
MYRQMSLLTIPVCMSCLSVLVRLKEKQWLYLQRVSKYSSSGSPLSGHSQRRRWGMVVLPVCQERLLSFSRHRRPTVWFHLCVYCHSSEITIKQELQKQENYAICKIPTLTEISRISPLWAYGILPKRPPFQPVTSIRTIYFNTNHRAYLRVSKDCQNKQQLFP